MTDLSDKAKFLAILKNYYQWPKDSKVPRAKGNDPLNVTESWAFF